MGDLMADKELEKDGRELSPFEQAERGAEEKHKKKYFVVAEVAGWLAQCWRNYWATNEGVRKLLLISQLCLVGVLTTYVFMWARGNWGMLTDPFLQNDDARTILFPFHQYGAAESLGNDPIAQEMLSLVPWGVRSLYLIFVPLVDVYWASKLVQGVAFGILIWAFVVLTRTRRTGIAAGAFLLFIVLHTSFAVDRIAGGLPRAFGFPCFALWLAGVLAQKRVPRFLSPVLLALTYPSIMNLILAAEGFMAIAGLGRIKLSVVGRRLRRYMIVVGVCLVCVMPAALGDSERGPIHTLQQARREPAFGKSGRLWILPFAKPSTAMSTAFLAPLKPPKESLVTQLDFISKDREMFSALFVGLFLLIPFLGWSPAPKVASAFFVGAICIYAASRIGAFRLYSPERYYSFGMRMACLVLLAASTAHIAFWLRGRQRAILRNFTSAALILFLWVVTGSGIVKNSGMTIDRKKDAELYEYIRTLPKDSRFASHIHDGDGIPYFGARATMGSFETLQPWFTGSWQRQKKRALATIDALYSTSQQEVLSYANENQVTHFLVKKIRYKRGISKYAGSFEPFTTYARKVVKKNRGKKFLFAHVPKEAIVFDSRKFLVVSVVGLQRAFSKEGPARRSP